MQTATLLSDVVDRNVSRAHVVEVPKRERAKFGRDPFRDHYLEMMTEAKELGLAAATDFEIAEHFGVAQNTLDSWKRRHPEFGKVLQIGKDIADGKVVASLYHKARGYSFRSEKIFQHEGSIIRAETIEHVPPDTTSIIFWLKNRQRQDWTDTQRIEAEVTTKAGDVREMALSMLATIKAGLAAPLQTIDGEIATEDRT